MCASGSTMPFRRVPLTLASLLSLVIALCLTEAGLTQPAHAAVTATYGPDGRPGAARGHGVGQ